MFYFFCHITLVCIVNLEKCRKYLPAACFVHISLKFSIMPVVFLSHRNTHLRFLYLLLKYFTLKTTQRETNLRYTLNLDKLAWIEVSSIKTGSCQSKKSITNYNHNDCNWWVKKPSFKVTALSSRYMQLLPVQQN